MGDDVRRAKVVGVIASGDDAGRKPVKKAATPVWMWAIMAAAIVVPVGGVAVVLLIRIAAVQADRMGDATRGAIRWGEAANADGVEVRVLAVEIAQWQCQSESRKVATSDVAGLTITLQISTRDTTKTYQTNALDHGATLADNFGQRLKPKGPIVSRGIGYMKVIGQLDKLENNERYTIRSDAPLTDKLVFDTPVEGAKVLYLKIARENYGGRGRDTFEIPDTAWKPKPRLVPKD